MSWASDLAQGFQAGSAMADSIRQGMLQDEMIKEKKRTNAIQEALLQKNNPGLYLSPQGPAKETGQEVDGEPVYDAKATPFKANDQSVQQLADGAYYSPDLKKEVDKDILKNKIEGMLMEKEALRPAAMKDLEEEIKTKNKFSINHYSPDSIIGTDEEIRQGKGYQVPGKQGEPKSVQVAPGHRVGHYDKDGNFMVDYEAPADATKKVLHNVAPGGVVIDENNKEVFRNPLTSNFDQNHEESLNLRRYNASLASLKAAEKKAESGDEDALAELDVAKAAHDHAAIRAGLMDPGEKDQIKEDIKLRNLDNKGAPKSGFLGFGKSGRTPEEEQIYQDILKKRNGGGKSSAPTAPRTVNDLYK